jgi:chromosome partitioning protein
MTNYKEYGLTQKCIAQLADLVPSTISRHITTMDINPLPISGPKKNRFSIDSSRKILFEVYAKNFQVLKKRHAFYNFKGGTGKTSISFQVSSHLALMGFNVLAIDADPQGHLSTSFGFNNDDAYLTLYDVIEDKTTIESAIKNVYEGLDCIPSNLSLTRLESDLTQMPKREEQIGMALKKVESKYDFIIFDTNPNISHINRNILTYCDLINIICETQPYSLNGMKLLMEDIARFYKQMHTQGAEIIVVPNKYEDRTATSAEAMTALRQFYANKMKPDFAIRKSEDINTSAKNSLPLALFCKSNSIALEDIIEFIHYLLDMSSKKKEVKDKVMSI